MQGYVLLTLLGLAAAEPFRSDEELRFEIEDAAKDSRQLADDLASMLARLEDVESLRTEKTVEVLEENAGVEQALEEMISRINNLAALTINSGSGSVDSELEQEEELHDTLLELENVAKEIEVVAASDDDAATSADIEKMASILKEVSQRIQGVQEGSGSVAKQTKKSKKSSKKSKSSKDNKIEELLSNLLKEGSGLSKEDEEDSGEVDASGEDTEDVVEETEDLFDVVEDTTDEDDEETSNNQEALNNQEARRPKQLDDGLNEDDEDTEPKEVCEDKEQSNRVQVCTPDFTNRESNLKFYSARPVSHQYCFNVTKTVCEERSQTVSKEVCTYEYQQKEVIAPAHLAEIGYERLHEGFYITKCEKKLVKDGYKEKEVEVCYKEDVSVPYRLPTVTERIEDFIELAAPVPEKRCRLVKYDVPEVVCKDMVNKECVTLYNLDKDTVQARVSEVVQQYRGDCEYRELEQTTQLCTVEEKVKRPTYNRPTFNAYRG